MSHPDPDALSPFDPSSSGDDNTISVSLESLQETARQLEALQKEKQEALMAAARAEREARENAAKLKAALETARAYHSSTSPDRFLSTWITDPSHPGLLRVPDPETGADTLWVALVLNKCPKVDTFAGKTSYKVAETVLRDCIPYDFITPSGHLLNLTLRGSLTLKLAADSQSDWMAFEKTGMLPVGRDSDTHDISTTHLFSTGSQTQSAKDAGPSPPNTHDLKQARLSAQDSRAFSAGQSIFSHLEKLSPQTAHDALSYAFSALDPLP